MYELSLKRIPDSGELKEEAVRLPLGEVGLGPPFMGPELTAGYEFRRYYDKIFGRVWADTRVELECGRCLKHFEAPIHADFALQFEPAKDQRPDDLDEDTADMSVATYAGESLAVGEQLRQELELLVPYAPVCREDCKGLCRRCGQDLNDGECGCPRDAEGGAFADLSKLFKKPNP
jgi:uncharacterized metal-binding protein YceD (DUF177 family)